MDRNRHLLPAAAVLGLVILAIAVWSAAGPSRARYAEPDRPKHARQQTEATSGREWLEAAYEKLPLAFVANRGPTDDRVPYFAQGPRQAFYLTRDEIVLAFVKGAPAPAAARAVRADAGPADGPTGVALALEFLGRNPHVTIEGSDREPGEVNYLEGNDPSRWHTGLPRYQQISYRELWPGVDLKL